MAISKRPNGTGNGKPRNPSLAGQPRGGTYLPNLFKNQATPASENVILNNRTFKKLGDPNGNKFFGFSFK